MQEWEDYYYNSGTERTNALNDLDQKISDLLQNRLLKDTDPEFYQYMKYDHKQLNYQYGRTKEDLSYKAEVLYHHAKKRIAHLKMEDAVSAVRHRVIGETWNGIIIREKNTVATILRIFPKLDVRKTTGAEDHLYAVDYELLYNRKTICGIQVKPKSYTYNTPYIMRAKAANKRKNELYKEKYGVPVIDIISDHSGKIYNAEYADFINGLIKK